MTWWRIHSEGPVALRSRPALEARTPVILQPGNVINAKLGLTSPRINIELTLIDPKYKSQVHPQMEPESTPKSISTQLRIDCF